MTFWTGQGAGHELTALAYYYYNLKNNYKFYLRRMILSFIL